jgi:hypothetical protein
VSINDPSQNINSTNRRQQNLERDRSSLPDLKGESQRAKQHERQRKQREILENDCWTPKDTTQHHLVIRKENGLAMEFVLLEPGWRQNGRVLLRALDVATPAVVRRKRFNLRSRSLTTSSESLPSTLACPFPGIRGTLTAMLAGSLLEQPRLVNNVSALRPRHLPFGTCR